jgi:hypothetical protein
MKLKIKNAKLENHASCVRLEETMIAPIEMAIVIGRQLPLALFLSLSSMKWRRGMG